MQYYLEVDFSFIKSEAAFPLETDFLTKTSSQAGTLTLHLVSDFCSTTSASTSVKTSGTSSFIFSPHSSAIFAGSSSPSHPERHAGTAMMGSSKSCGEATLRVLASTEMSAARSRMNTSTLSPSIFRTRDRYQPSPSWASTLEPIITCERTSYHIMWNCGVK